jgi:hypothetical protein
MPRKSFTPEQVIAKLRHIEVALANGKTLPQACKEATISTQSYYRWRGYERQLGPRVHVRLEVAARERSAASARVCR